jgi:hypothetical protein
MIRFAVLVLVSLIGATPALAQDSYRFGLALVAWVYSIDAKPDWRARAENLGLDDAPRSVTIGRLAISAEAGGLELEVRDITLDGYSAQSEGGFTAAAIRIGGITVKNAETDIEVSDADLKEIVVPALAGFSFDRREPFTSLLPALAALAGTQSASGTIGEIALVERFQKVENRISYRNVAYASLADGKLETVRAAPLKVESPSRNPLVDMTVSRAEARGIDLDAFLEVYDPARYSAGGEPQWRTAVARSDYGEITLNGPGMTMRIAGAEVENLSVRQPPEAFAPLANASLSDTAIKPELMTAFRTRHLADLIDAYRVGKLAFSDVTLNAAGIDELSLKRLFLSDASSERIGEIAVEGFVGAVPGQGGIAFQRFALGNILPPPTDRLIAAVDQSSRGIDVDFSALAPEVGFIEAEGVNFQAMDFAGATLAKLRIDASDYIGQVPAKSAVRIEGLDIPVAQVLPARVGGIITSLGYERIDADLAFDLAWNEADESFRLEEFNLDIADLGRTTADLVLTGVSRDMLEAANASALLAGSQFDRAKLTFEDKSLVDRSLSMRADLLKVPVDRLKQQLAGALPLMLAFVGNPETVKQIVPVLQTFIKTPGTLTVEAKPDEPVAVADIAGAVRTRPQSLPGLLSLTLSGTPGKGGEAPADAPKAGDPSATPPVEAPIRKSLSPESRPDTTGSTKPTPAGQP